MARDVMILLWTNPLQITNLLQITEGTQFRRMDRISGALYSNPFTSFSIDALYKYNLASIAKFHWRLIPLLYCSFFLDHKLWRHRIQQKAIIFILLVINCSQSYITLTPPPFPPRIKALAKSDFLNKL